MLTCGINDGHNSSAAIFEDGRLLSALQEERLNRFKNWQGFPIRAIEAQLSDMGATIGDVDAFVFAGREYLSIPLEKQRSRDLQMRAYKPHGSILASVKAAARRTFLRRLVYSRRNFQRFSPAHAAGVRQERIVVMDHHDCHAGAALYGPGFDPDVLILTCDGSGDGLCATVQIPTTNGQLQRLAVVQEEDSIGIAWACITSLMGMVPMEHEYKMMGMAPYASGSRVQRVAKIFADAFRMEDGIWRRRTGVPSASYAYEHWRSALEFARFDYVMAGLQLFTEQFLCDWVRYWIAKTGRRKLRLSGGVFMNVKANKAIMELPEVEDLYVFPSCGDETNSIGAAWLYLSTRMSPSEIRPLGPFYLGLEPSESEYREAGRHAAERGFRVQEPDSIEAATAALLASGEVVARVNGREEFGARALGNRSILADPSRGAPVVKLINQAIKSRDFWMPFAASVLDEMQDRYISNPKGIRAPYMILTFDSRNTPEVAAGCHPEDGTIRPQIVTKDWNPSYHKLLCAFRDLTGRGAILNTSFNLHGEPIVSRPVDAVDVLVRSGLRHLACGPLLISKDT